jgi:hypothetical protein
MSCRPQFWVFRKPSEKRVPKTLKNKGWLGRVWVFQNHLFSEQPFGMPRGRSTVRASHSADRVDVRGHPQLSASVEKEARCSPPREEPAGLSRGGMPYIPRLSNTFWQLLLSFVRFSCKHC